MIAKKGVALIWAVLTCMVLLLISTTVANTMIKESRMTLNTDFSSKARDAAESGLVWGKWCVENKDGGCASVFSGGDTASVSNIPFGNLGKYDVAFSKVTVNGVEVFKIESTGKVGRVVRKLNYVFNPLTMAPIPNSPASPEGGAPGNFNIISNNTTPVSPLPTSAAPWKKSFLFSYDFWMTSDFQHTTGDALNHSVRITFRTTTGKYLMIKHSKAISATHAGYVDIALMDNNGTTEIKRAQVNLSSWIQNWRESGNYSYWDKLDPYSIRVTLHYTKDVNAVISVQKRNRPAYGNTLQPCAVSATLGLRSTIDDSIGTLGNIDKILVDGTNGAQTPNITQNTSHSTGDGDYLNIFNNNSESIGSRVIAKLDNFQYLLLP